MSCDHKYVHLETIKQVGERPSFGISAAQEWKKTEIYFCEKCLDKQSIEKTAPGWESKPDWY